MRPLEGMQPRAPQHEKEGSLSLNDVCHYSQAAAKLLYD